MHSPMCSVKNIVDASFRVKCSVGGIRTCRASRVWNGDVLGSCIFKNAHLPSSALNVFEPLRLYCKHVYSLNQYRKLYWKHSSVDSHNACVVGSARHAVVIVQGARVVHGWLSIMALCACVVNLWPVWCGGSTVLESLGSASLSGRVEKPVEGHREGRPRVRLSKSLSRWEGLTARATTVTGKCVRRRTTFS